MTSARHTRFKVSGEMVASGVVTQPSIEGGIGTDTSEILLDPSLDEHSAVRQRLRSIAVEWPATRK